MTTPSRERFLADIKSSDDNRTIIVIIIIVLIFLFSMISPIQVYVV